MFQDNLKICSNLHLLLCMASPMFIYNNVIKLLIYECTFSVLLLFSSLKGYFWYLSSARISTVQQEPWLQKQQLFWLLSDFCNPLKNCESCSLSFLLQGGKDKRKLIAYTIHWGWQRSPNLLKSTQTNRWPTAPIAPRCVRQTPWLPGGKPGSIYFPFYRYNCFSGYQASLLDHKWPPFL